MGKSVPLLIGGGGGGIGDTPVFHPKRGLGVLCLLPRMCNNSELSKVCEHHSGPASCLRNVKTNNSTILN